jgi:succinoglycan biosynthesis protein ExoO
MANLNGELYLDQAIQSVLRQSHRDLEVIISDDGSSDGSLTIIRKAMAQDARVRLVKSSAPSGPGSARNRALAQATGDWIAICDSDDLLHPERLERLLKAAHALKADIVADDLIYFGDSPIEQHGTLLQSLALQSPQAIDALAMVTGDLCGHSDLSLGYLKPLMRRSSMGDLRYNERLHIDEDYDLYLRLLLAGARFVVIPDALYLYRRHARSTSHRQSAASLGKMVVAQEAFLNAMPDGDTDLVAAIARRMRCHSRELNYARMLEDLKARKWIAATLGLLRSPKSFVLLLQSIRERGKRNRLTQNPARSPLKLVLCQRGHDLGSDYPGFTRFDVPGISSAPWSPSSATIWADLAQLACLHDLQIVAADRAGEFALGLVPQFVSAEVRITPQAPSGVTMQARATDFYFRPEVLAGEA